MQSNLRHYFPMIRERKEIPTDIESRKDFV